MMKQATVSSTILGESKTQSPLRTMDSRIQNTLCCFALPAVPHGVFSPDFLLSHDHFSQNMWI